MDEQPNTSEIIESVAEIVSAYVSHNSLPQADLPTLIGDVHQALATVANPSPAEAGPEQPRPKPAEIKRSITPDHLVSFEDGKPYKSLKRHLAGRGLTPQAYREKWGLPVDYPMVAPNYSAQRSALARSLGLGQKRKGLRKVSPEDALRVEAFEEGAESPAGEAAGDDPALAAIVAASEEGGAAPPEGRPRKARAKKPRADAPSA